MWWLSSAILLAKKWYHVTIIEKNDKSWGRINILKKQWFTWDMWPSRYLMPDIFENFFSCVDKRIEDYLDLKKLTPNYRVYFTWEHQDNFQNKPPYLDIFSDINQTKQQFDYFDQWSWDQLEKYLTNARNNYDVAMNNFVFKEYDNVWELFHRNIIKSALDLHIFSTLYRHVSHYIKNEDLKKVLLYTTVFLGTSPYEASAAYNIMSHLDFNEGVFYPQWGIYEISKALQSIAQEFGVQFIFNTPVEKILVENGTTVGIQSGENIYPADIVISNADMRHTETKLLEKKYQTYPESYRKKKTMSPSWFIMYLWVDWKLPQLLHHTLVFANDRKEWFRNIFHVPQWSEHPNYYICNPSKTDPSVSPQGKENLFVFVPIAPWLEADQTFLESYWESIIDDISKHCSIPDFKKRIEVKELFTTQDFKSYYNAYKGTALWLAHVFTQSAFLRPKNQSKKVHWLYYVGGYTTPGIWVPMCLLSWQLVAEKVIKNN